MKLTIVCFNEVSPQLSVGLSWDFDIHEWHSCPFQKYFFNQHFIDKSTKEKHYASHFSPFFTPPPISTHTQTKEATSLMQSERTNNRQTPVSPSFTLPMATDHAWRVLMLARCIQAMDHSIMTISRRGLPAHCCQVKVCGACHLKANLFLAAVRPAQRFSVAQIKRGIVMKWKQSRTKWDPNTKHMIDICFQHQKK